MCSYRIRIIEISQRETGFKKAVSLITDFQNAVLAHSSQTGASSVWMFEKYRYYHVSFIVHTLQL